MGHRGNNNYPIRQKDRVISTNQVRTNYNLGNRDEERENHGYFARQEYDRSTSNNIPSRGRGNNFQGGASRGMFVNRGGLQSGTTNNWRGESNNRGRDNVNWRGHNTRGVFNQRNSDNQQGGSRSTKHRHGSNEYINI